LFVCIFYQIKAALMSMRDFYQIKAALMSMREFSKTLKISQLLQTFS